MSDNTDFLTKVQETASQQEDEDKRLSRLVETNEKTGIDVNSLDRLDKAGQVLALRTRDNNEGNMMGLIESDEVNAAPLIPMVNMLASNDGLVRNLGKLPVKFPSTTAHLVYYLHKLYEYEGVYETVGVEQLTAEEIYAHMGVE